MQNQVCTWLQKRYGKRAVGYEIECVDLRVRTASETIFIEIKTASTAKKCIREALGQLLEYNHFPRKALAEKLVVIGDAIATSDDIAYIEELRTCYSLPLHYAQFVWSSLNRPGFRGGSRP